MHQICISSKFNLPISTYFLEFCSRNIKYSLKKAIKFKNPYIYMPIMFFGEFFVGIIIYIYEKKVRKSQRGEKGEKQEKYFMAIKLIKNENEQEDDYFTPLDSKIKIII